jgi:lipopolysaccharide transport system permease protein
LSAPHPIQEIHIRPHRAWLQLDVRELWEYRDLLWLLVYRDFVAKYKQTILGPAWFVLQPVLTTLVFTVVFGNIAKIPTGGLPPVLFYLCGLLGWSYFSQTVSATSNTFTANQHIFGKVYFPRLVVPFAAAVSNLLAFGLQLLTFLAFWLYFREAAPSGAALHFDARLLWLPLLVLQTGLLALGVGCCMAALTAKYRDLQHLMAFLLQLWLYATPVIYPLAEAPEKWRGLLLLNPMTAVTEHFKIALLGQGSPEGLLLSAAMTLTVFIGGILLFRRTERTAMDTV